MMQIHHIKKINKKIKAKATLFISVAFIHEFRVHYGNTVMKNNDIFEYNHVHLIFLYYSNAQYMYLHSPLLHILYELYDSYCPYTAEY